MSECACYPAQDLRIIRHAHWDEMPTRMGAGWDRHLDTTRARRLGFCPGPDPADSVQSSAVDPPGRGRLGLWRWAPSHHRAGPQRRLAGPLPRPSGPSRPHDPRVGPHAAVTRTLLHITLPPSLPLPLPQQRHAMHSEKMMLSWWEGSLIPFSDGRPKKARKLHAGTWINYTREKCKAWYMVSCENNTKTHRHFLSENFSLKIFSLKIQEYIYI